MGGYRNECITVETEMRDVDAMEGQIEGWRSVSESSYECY